VGTSSATSGSRRIASRPTLAKGAFAWLHLGAGIGGGTGANGRIQASDDDLEQVALDAMRRAAAAVAGRVPRGTDPGGEARNIHLAGGRYVSLLGGTPYFHNPDDDSVAMVNIAATARYARALSDIVVQLARRARGPGPQIAPGQAGLD